MGIYTWVYLQLYELVILFILEILTVIRVVIQPLKFCDTFNNIHTYSYNIIIVIIRIRVLK